MENNLNLFQLAAVIPPELLKRMENAAWDAGAAASQRCAELHEEGLLESAKDWNENGQAHDQLYSLLHKIRVVQESFDISKLTNPRTGRKFGS